MNRAAILVTSVDQRFCITGGDVSGRVYLAIQRDFLPADSLVLSLVGEERTTVHETNETREVVRFLEETWALADYPEGRITRGHFEFPFQILIPPLLPSSLKMKSGREGCGIHYYLEVRLYLDAYQEEEHYIAYKKHLIVKSQPIRCPSSSPVTIPLTRENLHGNWCSQIGSIILGLYTPQVTLSPLNVFQISFLALPLCGTEQIQSIEIAIVESITWKTRTPPSIARHHDILLWQTIVQPKDIPDIPEVISTPPIDMIGYNEIDAETNRVLTEYLRSLHFSVTAIIRKDAYPSCKGRLISIQHYLRLRVTTPFRVPELFLPIRIQQFAEMIQPPQLTTRSNHSHRNSNSSSDRRETAPVSEATELVEAEEEEEETQWTRRPASLPVDWSPVVVEPVYLSRSAIQLIAENGSERPSIASSAYLQAEELDLAVLPVTDQSYRIAFVE